MSHYRLIVILGALFMLGALSIDDYLPAFPAIAAHFLVSLPAAQQTLSLYLFAFMTLINIDITCMMIYSMLLKQSIR